MKKSTVLLIGFFLFTNCGNVTGTPELPPPEELILGNWHVHDVLVDGINFPVTNPGAGQIQVMFEEDRVEYIYPAVDENNIPTSSSDTLFGEWSFLDNYSKIYISNYDDKGESLEWDILELGVGLLHTSYDGRSVTDTTVMSTYEFIYNLVN